MSAVVVFFVVAIVTFLIVRQFFTVKSFKSKEEYLEYKQKEKELLEQEEDWDDELIDKKSFDFLFIGAIATILFLVFGLFTGNSFYFILVLFVITAALYIYYLPPKDKF